MYYWHFTFGNPAEILEPKNYPWGEPLDVRQRQILDHLKDELKLNILSEFLPAEQMTVSDPLVFLSSDGRRYECVSHEKEEAAVTNEFSVSDVMARLSRMCIAFPIDWWSYEWCHQRQVKQFHIEATKRSKAKRNPEWSLGMFDSYEVVMDANGEPSEIVEYFSGGQNCDENGEARSSEVGLSCSSSLA